MRVGSHSGRPQGTVQGCTVLSVVVTLRSDRDVGAVASDTPQRCPFSELADPGTEGSSRQDLPSPFLWHSYCSGVSSEGFGLLARQIPSTIKEWPRDLYTLGGKDVEGKIHGKKCKPHGSILVSLFRSLFLVWVPLVGGFHVRKSRDPSFLFTLLHCFIFGQACLLL